MKETKSNISERLRKYRELYDESRLAYSEETERLEKSMRQYLGSSEIDGGENASIVRNITYELIESQINSDIPTPKVSTVCYTEKREQNAISIERLCASVRDRLPFEEMNDADERYTYVYGASVWYVEWDSEDDDGGVRVHCISPINFLGQVGVTDIRDMEYCFLRFITTKGELMRKYGISDADAALCSCEYRYDTHPASDTVEMVICFYRDAEGEIGRIVFSGELLLSDIPGYYRRKKRVCKSCGGDLGSCKCRGEGFETVDLHEESLDGGARTLPYHVPRDFPIVIRRNTMGEEGVFGGSDCERIRPIQQAINKVESRILQKLLRSGVTPIMPEDSTVTLTNSIFGQVIKMRPGESAENYGKLDTTPDISQDIEEADRLYDQAKRILGISDALQGTDSFANESGYARQLKINQASGRLESKKRMKHFAYSEIYRLIFEHYLAFADSPRPLSYKDSLGDLHVSAFNRHDFIEEDGDGGYCYGNGYLFSVDQGADTEYRREVLWERNLKNLESGTLGARDEPTTLLRYWQAQEKAHYPSAGENVEYFKSIIKKKKDDEDTYK